MNLHGGAPQILTQDSYHNVCPSWSHDGKWIYFALPAVWELAGLEDAGWRWQSQSR